MWWDFGGTTAYESLQFAGLELDYAVRVPS